MGLSVTGADVVGADVCADVGAEVTGFDEGAIVVGPVVPIVVGLDVGKVVGEAEEGVIVGSGVFGADATQEGGIQETGEPQEIGSGHTATPARLHPNETQYILAIINKHCNMIYMKYKYYLFTQL